MRSSVGWLWLVLLAAGCVTHLPAVSKSEMGNLEINVTAPNGQPLREADLYLDGVFVGNLSPRLPVLHARRGERVVRVQSAGFRPYERRITILGEPNHQVLNVIMNVIMQEE